MVLFPAGLLPVRIALVLATAVLTLVFIRRVIYHLRYAKLTRAHLSFNPLATARSPG
jgi:hypothetical protein